MTKEIKITDRISVKELFGIRSYIGLECRLIPIFLITMIIVCLFCPFCNYNPTVIDELKRTVSFNELQISEVCATWIIPLTVILFLLPFIDFLILAKRAEKNDNVLKGCGIHIIFGIIELILASTIAALVEVSCDWYEIPIEHFKGLEVKLDVGAYIFIIFPIILGAFHFTNMLLLKLVACGNMESNILFLFKNKTLNIKSKKDASINDTSLSSKLNELVQLKNSGILTEEEFNKKKEDLLNRY